MEWSLLNNSNGVVSTIMSFYFEHLEIWGMMMDCLWVKNAL